MSLRGRIAASILIALPFFVNLGTSALWDSNEALYGETAREMLERSDFINPTFNYQPRTQKPPLTYWVIAASYRAFGVSEFSTRLPGALAGCLLLAFLVWFLHRFAGGWTVGFLAAAILATTSRFFIVVRRLPIDCLLTVLIGMALLLLYRGAQLADTGAPASTADKQAGGRASFCYFCWLVSGLLTGLGFLTKGPVAPLLVLLIAALFFWTEKRLPGWGAVACFFAAFVAAAVPYYGILFLQNGGAVISNFLIKENIGRFTTVEFGPQRSAFYYFQVLLVDAFPWSWFLPAAVVLRKYWRHANPPLVRFCWIWFGVIFVFFSFSHNKQEYYVLPAYTALAILLAHFFTALQKSLRQPSRWLQVTALVVALAVGVVSGIGFWLTRFLPVGPAGWLVTIPLLLAVVIAARLFWRGHPQQAAHSLALLMLFTVVAGCLIVLPVLETVRPTRALTAEIARLRQTGDRAGYFQFTSPSMSFYLRSPIFELYDTEPLQVELDRPGRSFVLLPSEEFERLPSVIRDRLEVIASAPHLEMRGSELLKIRSMTSLPRVLLVRER